MVGTMTKPHEETWRANAIKDTVDLLHSDGTHERIMYVEPRDDPRDPSADWATLRLAAQAPAMARKLLELQWAGNAQVGIGDGCDSVCPACDGAAPGSAAGGPPGHYPDCTLVAVLKAAGVLE